MCIKEAKSWTHVLLVIQTWTEIGDLSQKWPSMWNVLYICITFSLILCQKTNWKLHRIFKAHLLLSFEIISNNSFLFFFFCLLIINEGLASCWYYIYILAQKQDAVTLYVSTEKETFSCYSIFQRYQ